MQLDLVLLSPSFASSKWIDKKKLLSDWKKLTKSYIFNRNIFSQRKHSRTNKP